VKSNDRYDSLIQYYAEQNNLDWLQIKAQIKQESAFDPDARSHADAMGLGQFMPMTWVEWAENLSIKGADPFNPEHNIRLTCAYMRWLLRQFNQDLRAALAAYNWGIGNVKKAMAKHGLAWLGFAPLETIQYLRKINENYNDYMKGFER
jgi:soluble lytic murein transglycosylase-like protein